MRPTPTQWLLLGVSTIVFALALWGGAMAVLNPDPTRWEGWGAYGAAAAGAVGLAGVAALIRWPVAGLGLVLIAAILGALAMPWLWPIAIVPAAAALWRWRTRHGLVAAGQP